MQMDVFVINDDKAANLNLCALFESMDHRAIALSSLTNLESQLRGIKPHLLVLDLDTLSVDNATIRDMKRQNPQTFIIVMSSQPFHPHLEESLRNHIYASITKPVSKEELSFWLRSITMHREEL